MYFTYVSQIKLGQMFENLSPIPMFLSNMKTIIFKWQIKVIKISFSCKHFIFLICRNMKEIIMYMVAQQLKGYTNLKSINKYLYGQTDVLINRLSY